MLIPVQLATSCLFWLLLVLLLCHLKLVFPPTLYGNKYGNGGAYFRGTKARESQSKVILMKPFHSLPSHRIVGLFLLVDIHTYNITNLLLSLSPPATATKSIWFLINGVRSILFLYALHVSSAPPFIASRIALGDGFRRAGDEIRRRNPIMSHVRPNHCRNKVLPPPTPPRRSSFKKRRRVTSLRWFNESLSYKEGNFFHSRLLVLVFGTKETHNISKSLRAICYIVEE